MEVRKFKTKQAIQWINCGWRLARKRYMTWFSTALLLTAITLVLSYIPVIGPVVTLFLFPIILCGSMIVTDRFNNPDAARPQKANKRTKGFIASVGYTKDMLLSGFSKEDRILGMIGLAAAMLVFGIVIQIIMNLVSGEAVNNPAHFWQLSGSQFMAVFAAYAVAYFIFLVLAMCFFYAIPLYMLRDFDLGAAVKLSLKAVFTNQNTIDPLRLSVFTNLLPFVAYAVTLVAPLVIAIIVAGIFSFAGFFILLAVGSVVWVLFINSMYCAYRLSFK